MKKNIYLDSAAHYPICNEVKEELRWFDYSRLCNNQSSHSLGVNCNSMVEDARNTIAKCLGCEQSEIYFTSGASESAKIIVDSLKDYYGTTPNLSASPFEHDCIKKLCTIGGQYTEKNVQMLVSNITGAIFNTSKSYVCDITSAIGNIEINLNKMNCLYAFGSSEKIGAPAGCGFLYAHKDATPPTMYNKTENVLGIYLMSIAMKKVCNPDYIDRKSKYCKTMADKLKNYLDDYGIDYIDNSSEININSILNLSFKDIDGEALKNYLDANGIYVSTGSACHSGASEPDPTLVELGVPADYIMGSIRFSFNEYNTMGEIKIVANKINNFMKMIGD